MLDGSRATSRTYYHREEFTEVGATLATSLLGTIQGTGGNILGGEAEGGGDDDSTTTHRFLFGPRTHSICCDVCTV